MVVVLALSSLQHWRFETRYKQLKILVAYLDLVAMPLGQILFLLLEKIEHLAYFGLQVINTNPRPGIKAIIAEVKKEELTITDVVFIIAPRINAAGRMKHGNHAVTLLTETDFTLAAEFALEINKFNIRPEGNRSTNYRRGLAANSEEHKEQERFYYCCLS